MKDVHIIDSDIKNAFSESRIFSGMTDQKLERIMEVCLIKKVDKGFHLFFQDDGVRNLYFIYSGKIKIYKTDISGKEHILNFLTNGEVFPLESFYPINGYPASAQIMENAVLMVVPISSLHEIVVGNNQFLFNIYKLLGKEIAELQDTLDDQLIYNSYKQIVKLLIRLGENHGENIQDGLIRLRIQLTNRELADMIGVRRETISRTLTKLIRNGKVNKNLDGNLIFHPKILLGELV